MTRSNLGYQYERTLGDSYRDFESQVAAVGSSSMDLSFQLQNTPINVEVKFTKNASGAKNLNYGQTKLYQTQNGTWQFVQPTTEEEEDRISILTRAGILGFINQRWSSKKSTILEKLKLVENKKEAARLAAQERAFLGENPRIGLINDREAIKRSENNVHFIGEEEYPFSNLILLKNAVQSYYATKGADYVQIKNFGFYRLGDRDPIADISNGQIRIPLFVPSTVFCRPRLKGYGKGKYDFTVALEAYGFPTNQIQITETVEKEMSENKKLSYKVGKFFNSDLDDNKFKNYLYSLNQSS